MKKLLVTILNWNRVDLGLLVILLSFLDPRFHLLSVYCTDYYFSIIQYIYFFIICGNGMMRLDVKNLNMWDEMLTVILYVHV